MNSENPSESAWGSVIAAFLFENRGSALLPVNGNSMAPLLRHNRTIEVRAVAPAASLTRGEIYVFRSASKLVVHRFVCINKGRAVFSGDNRTAVEIVDQNEIVGRCEVRQHACVRYLVSLINILIFWLPICKKVLFYFKRMLFAATEVLHEEEI
jgi:Peptidase S24-like